MNDLLKEEIQEEISGLQTKLSEINDGVKLSESTAKEVLKITQLTVAKANATESVDERMKLLVSGLQETVRFLEDQSQEITKNTETLKLEISTLERIVDKIDLLEDEKKK